MPRPKENRTRNRVYTENWREMVDLERSVRLFCSWFGGETAVSWSNGVCSLSIMTAIHKDRYS